MCEEKYKENLDLQTSEVKESKETVVRRQTKTVIRYVYPLTGLSLPSLSKTTLSLSYHNDRYDGRLQYRRPLPRTDLSWSRKSRRRRDQLFYVETV